MIQRIILTIALFAAMAGAHSQPYCNVRTFGVNDGLAANVISGIDQDDSHLMWFSTWNGLSCYDGYRFTTFRDQRGENEVLSSNRLKAIGSNSQQDVWVITYDGRLYLFNTDQCQYVYIGETLQKQFSQDIRARKAYPLENGHTWIKTENENIALRIDDSKARNAEGIEFFGGQGKPMKGALKKVWLDKQGGEWLFTTKEIQLVGTDFKTEQAFEHAENIGKGVLLATPDGKAAIYGNGKLTYISMPENIQKVNGITAIDSTTIALATDQGALIINDKGQTTLKSIQTPSQPYKEAESIYADSKKRLWVFTQEAGVTMLNTATGETRHLTTTAIASPLTTTTEKSFVLEDKEGTIWVAAQKGTFAYYNETTGTLIPYIIRPKGFERASQPTINKYFIDKEKDLWFTSTHDLTLVTTHKHLFNIVPMTENTEVRATFINDKGRVFAGLDNGTIAIIEDGKIIGYANYNKSVAPQPVKLTTKVFAIYEDSKGRVWTGTKGDGLYVTDPNSYTHFMPDEKDKYSINSKNVYDIFEDKKGRIWVATYGGGLNLVEETDGTIRFINANNRLNSYPVKEAFNTRRLTATKEGIILLSTTAGLITFGDTFDKPENIKFNVYKHKHGDVTSPAADDVLQTVVTKKGQIFIATMAGGLQELKEGNPLGGKLIFNSLPLSQSTGGGILSITEDGDGCLWIARENCIEKYNPETKESGIYGIGEIDDDIDFSEAKPHYDPNSGTMVIGAMNKLVTFKPKDMTNAGTDAKIVFTGVQFQGEQTQRPVLYTQQLDIPSDKRNCTIFFSAIQYDNNRFVRYAYKIDGVDKDWNYTTQPNTAFGRLPHGHLKLLVKSTNADGVWLDNIATLNIYSHPTFWETIWAKLLYLLIAAGIVAAAAYIYNLKKRNEMEREMSKMRADFFTEVSHKLRTPLTLIGGPVTDVLETESLTDNAKGMLEMVQRNTRRMLNLVNKMLEHNKEDNYVVDDEEAPVFATTGNISDEKVPDTEAFTNDNIEEDEPKEKTSILVVEDNDDLRSFLQSILCRKYNVMTAPNGAEGLKTAREKMPDFILTDVMMPVMDGMTMVHNIKQDSNICHIPIVILSAKASMEDRVKGLQEGVDDYISKPFSATYLKHRIDNIIAQRHLLQESLLQQMSETMAENEHKKAASKDNPANEATSAAPESEVHNAAGQNANKGNGYKLKSPEIVDNDKKLMETLMEFIEKNVDDPDLKVEDLADAVNLGRTAFFNKIKSIVGLSPLDFLRHLRLQKAQELIVKSNDTYSQIAYSVGFSDPKYFSRCFKKETGLSPSEYRAKNKLTIDN